MHNFPFEQNPKFWSEYYGHPEAKQLAQKFILGGVSKMPRSSFISGPSGCGKTTFVKLLIKSMRCLDRLDTEYEPCGKCAACTEEDVRLSDRSISNVIWVQPGGFADEPETLNRQVKMALAQGAKGHRHSDRPDRDILWIVFDEWQEFPSNVRTEVLMRAESEPPSNNVCYVFMTMQEDKLTLQNLIAFKRRGNPIYLNGFEPAAIRSYLLNKFQLPAATATLIADHSLNSLGLAIAFYDNIRQLDPHCNVDVASYVLRACTNQERKQLWTLLEGYTKYVTLMEFVQKLTMKASPAKLVMQLQKDILHSADLENDLSADRQHAVVLLNQYLQSPVADLTTFLIPLMKTKLVSDRAIFLEEDGALNYLAI